MADGDVLDLLGAANDAAAVLRRVPRHVALIMDGNGRWAANAACRDSKAIGAAWRR